MAFKLSSLNGRVNSDKSLDKEGLPLFDWNHLKDKENAIDRLRVSGSQWDTPNLKFIGYPRRDSSHKI